MSFITGAVGNGRSIAVLAQVDDANGNPLDAWRLGVWRDGSWRAEHSLDSQPVALCALQQGSNSWAVLASEGEVTLIEEAISAPRLRVEHVVEQVQYPFTMIRPFANGLAVTGMARQVHWSDGVRGWRPLGQNMPQARPDELIGFEALAEASGELYACGWSGEIWRLNNNFWSQVASPTNIILTGAAATGAQEIVICGRLGTLLRGMQDNWSIVDHDHTNEDFWSVASFRGHTYVASLRGIYQLTQDELTPVDDASQAASYYHLSANDEIMISVGADCVLVLDEDNWVQIA